MNGLSLATPGRDDIETRMCSALMSCGHLGRSGVVSPRCVACSSVMPGVFLLKKLAGASASVSFGVLADCGRAVMRQAKLSLTQVAS